MERSRLTDHKLLLYEQKTGTPFYCPMPPDVVKTLAAVENANPMYVFYDGSSQPESMVRKFGEISQPRSRELPSHRFRDT